MISNFRWILLFNKQQQQSLKNTTPANFSDLIKLLVCLLSLTNMTYILSFLQQYFTKLSERTVAYINVDIAVFGKKPFLPPRSRHPMPCNSLSHLDRCRDKVGQIMTKTTCFEK